MKRRKSGFWNYRLVLRRDRTLAVHEVYYRKDGVACAMTVNPITALPGDMAMIQKDVRKHPIYREPKRFPKADWWGKTELIDPLTFPKPAARRKGEK